MKANNSSNRIQFLSVPESLRGQIEQIAGDDFYIDPSIPIPAEIPAGQDKLDLENLSWEMIISGMIRVIADDPEGDDANYYRRFVLAVKPDILSEFSEAAILKARNGEYDIALEILAALHGLYPDSASIILNMALVLEENADSHEQAGREKEADRLNEKAFEYYKALILLDPPYENALFNAGFFFIKQQNYEKAKECFSRYIPLSEDSEKKAKARAVVKEIESRSLDDIEFREAYDFIRMGEEERGIEKIHEFLVRHPEVWNAWFLLGWGLRRIERWEDGEKAFRKALELGGGTCDTHNELALCLIQQDDLQGARQELESALKLEPENTKVISNLGIVALKSGNDAEAAAFFRTVSELDPTDPLAADYLERLGDI